MKIALPASSIPCGDVPPSRDSRQVEQDLPQEWGLFGASSPTAASRQPRSEDSRHGRGRTGAPDVVSVAVGMLGLDVHEAPLSMAETWLSYYRNEFGGSAGNTAGCGGGDGGLVGPPAAASGPDAGAGGAPALAAAPPEWQLRAVSRIRELAAQGEVSASRAFPAAGGDAAASSNGPKLAECAQLSEFVLRRIVHCVATLRGPEGREGLTQVGGAAAAV
ncbi:unnamed protein product [Prorocentrum cordatum]|uniref:Uncharacterized protein n=1 Tax=Prorocentrum cordatum TaxID=2364126 RepID=A0ABN9V988_9DINO|nr:unnamed protein product [Polarella glacialis]